MKQFQQKDYEKGQVLVVVILVIVTALTVGLSVVTRSLTSIRTSQEEESSERAFSAAEAGIEQALTTNESVSGLLPNNSSYSTKVITTSSNTEFLPNNGAPVFRGDVVDIWLSNYPNYSNPWTGDLTIYWGQEPDVCAVSESQNTLAALEIILIYGTKANPQLTRYAVDPCLQRSAINKFEFIPAGGDIVKGKPLSYKKTIPVSSGLLMRVIPLYAQAVVGIKGCDGSNNNCISLPTQGFLIESVGTSANSRRKVITFHGYSKLPAEMFQFTLVSPE